MPVKNYILRCLYGRKYDRYHNYDLFLNLLKDVPHVAYKDIYHGEEPDGVDDVVDFLIEEGWLIEGKYAVSISAKGKIKRESGGFIQDLWSDAMRKFIICISVIASISTIAAFVMLFRPFA